MWCRRVEIKRGYTVSVLRDKVVVSIKRDVTFGFNGRGKVINWAKPNRSR